MALVLALDERNGLSESERRRLDREIGSQLPEVTGFGLLRAWLAKAPGPALRGRIERVASSLRMLRWLLVSGGFFLGWLAAAALLSIEAHDGRINVVLCLALLVLVPLGMLVLAGLGWILSLRPVRSGSGTSLGDWMRSAGLGRLVMRLVSPGVRSDLEVLLGRFSAQGRLYGRVQRGQLLVWSQILGLGFGLGSLAATLLFVVFTDLAFGWSTTLDVDAVAVHRALEFVARPWARLWPDASPSLDLVEATRFFRVESGNHVHFVDPIVFGGWWPFLVMAIGIYSVLPRLVALIGLDYWLSRELRRAMLLTPGVDRLFDRLETPIVESRAEEAEGETGRVETGLVPLVDGRRWLAEQGEPMVSVVRWAESASDSAIAEAMGIGDGSVREAGGRRSLEDDAAVIAESAASRRPVGVCVRAYEPPLLDLLDFLSSLRRALGSDLPICVFLFDGDDEQSDSWRRKLVTLGDPRLCVARMES